MYKKIWKDEEGVSPVIATILMVAITVVLAGVLVVYMQQFSQGPGEEAPKGTFVASSFSNQQEPTTINGGGWSVSITALSGGKPTWGEVSVSLTKSGATVTEMTDIKSTVSDLEQTTSNPKWYLKGSNASANIYYVEAGAQTALSGNEGNLNAGEFETVSGAYFIVVDNNGDGNMDSNDVVFVYKDHNGDGTDDLTSGYTIKFALSSGGNIGSTDLI